MSELSDYATTIEGILGGIKTSVTNVVGDVTRLAAEIVALKESLGELDPEVQARLDGIVADLGGVAANLDALDMQTPEAPPEE